MSNEKKEFNSAQIQRTLKLTKRKMTIRIIRICLLCICAVLLAVSIPNVLYTAQISRIQKAQDAAMLIHQFSSPNNVSGYSISTENRGFKKDIVLYYNNIVGRNAFDGKRGEITTEYNLLTGKLDLYYPICGAYMHIERYEGLDAEYRQRVDENNEAAIRALNKNRDNTVVLADVSLNVSYSLDELLSLTEGYDLEINWIAVETGYEGMNPPKHIGMPMQQYYTLGIPTKLYTTDTIFNPAELKEKNVEEYIEQLKSHIMWLKDNQGLLKNDMWMLEDGLCDEIFNETIKCYGIQINGPTSEVYELIQSLECTYVNISGIELWYW